MQEVKFINHLNTQTMNAVVLIIIILVVMLGFFRVLVDLQNDPTLTAGEIVELNINRLKNLFKRKK